MKKAFTLMEVICTLAVISIVLLIASPSVISFVRKDRLRTTTDRLVSDIRYSKMYAVSKSESSVHMLFNNAEGSRDYDSYLIYSYNGTIQNNIKKVRLPDGVRVCSREEDGTLDISGKLSFSILGNVLPHACTIVLKDIDTGKKDYITLTIGYTRIMRVPR